MNTLIHKVQKYDTKLKDAVSNRQMHNASKYSRHQYKYLTDLMSAIKSINLSKKYQRGGGFNVARASETAEAIRQAINEKNVARQAAMGELQAKIVSDAAEMVALNQMVKSSSARVAELEAADAEAKRQLATLQASERDLQTLIARVQDELNALQSPSTATAAETAANLAAVSGEKDALATAKAIVDEQLAKEKEAVEQKTEELNTLQGQLEAAQRATQSATDEKDAITATMQKEQGVLNAILTEVVNLYKLAMNNAKSLKDVSELFEIPMTDAQITGLASLSNEQDYIKTGTPLQILNNLKNHFNMTDENAITGILTNIVNGTGEGGEASLVGAGPGPGAGAGAGAGAGVGSIGQNGGSMFPNSRNQLNDKYRNLYIKYKSKYMNLMKMKRR